MVLVHPTPHDTGKNKVANLWVWSWCAPRSGVNTERDKNETNNKQQKLLQSRLCCRFLDRSKSFSVRRSEWRPYVQRQEGTLRTGLPNKGLLRTTRKSTNCPLAPAWCLSLHFWDCVAVIIPSTSSFQVGLWLALNVQKSKMLQLSTSRNYLTELFKLMRIGWPATSTHW